MILFKMPKSWSFGWNLAKVSGVAQSETELNWENQPNSEIEKKKLSLIDCSILLGTRDSIFDLYFFTMGLDQNSPNLTNFLNDFF